MYVSPRPTYSFKSRPTQKFLFEFPIEVLFHFWNFGYVVAIVISISAFTIAEASVDTIAGMVL
jgi:hypothetical protein